MKPFRARIRLLKTEEGGRKSWIASGYRPIFSYAGALKDATGKLLDRQKAFPGDELEVEISFLTDWLLPSLKVGSRFELTEGGPLVAEGEVISIDLQGEQPGV